MLQVKLKCHLGQTGPIALHVADIANIAGGRLATYGVRLRQLHPTLQTDTTGRPPAWQATLCAYPRWNEPVNALVARCLATVQEHPDVLARTWSTFDHISIAVFLNVSLLTVTKSEVSAGLLLDGATVLEAPRLSAGCSPWLAAQYRLSHVVWGSTDMPPVPPATDPPVYEKEGQRYCRIKDLPPEAAAVYARHRMGSTTPCISGVDDAVYVHDIVRFLAG